MSHVIGTVIPVTVPIGPDSGDEPSAANTWLHEFTPPTPPIGVTKFVILHFSAASFPPGNRLEVDLGYAMEKDVFTSADGNEFWTRPVNVAALPGGRVSIRYITSGSGPPTGGVVLDKYGRGEQHAGEQDPGSQSNSDPFLLDLIDNRYVEPTYDPFWFCSSPPNWENVACIAPAGDIRKTVAQSVGMMVAVEVSHITGEAVVSTCSVTLVGPDLVLTAGHCMADPDEDVKSTSVIFNYQVECDGAKPGGYVGRFHKAKRVVRHRWVPGVSDYCLMQINVPPGGLGIPPIEMRSDPPAVGEEVFGVHHPNGAVKKLSISHPGFETVVANDPSYIHVDFDVSGGSSGSGLFDTAGRITGVASAGYACNLSYFSTHAILQELATPEGPALTRDVMIVFDRSGSMSMDAGTGRTKIVEAQDAASLFVQLIRADTGNRLGLVSFSTAVSDPIDHSLADVVAAAKLELIGDAPFTSGKIGDLMTGGNTTIGGGLKAAGGQLPASANPRAILLLTDGLQNTPPMIEDTDVQGAIAGIDVHAIGFGTEASLDGALLTQVAETHNGLYVRAGDGLNLKKFFSLAFGNIFEDGALVDPEFDLPRDQRRGRPISFNVCGEETITVVVGWDNSDARLFAQVTTPGGVAITGGTPGVEQSNGRTWTFLRIPLPHDGERDGVWRVNVMRPDGRGQEFPPRAPALRYFINVIANGGPNLSRVRAPTRFYTGDTINPMVMLGYKKGGVVPRPKVRVTVSRPDTSLGNILSRAKLGQPVTRDGDTIPARQARLLTLEAESRKPVVGYKQTAFELISDPAHTGGAFKPRGLFGNPLKDLLDVEGNYTFHVVASYGTECVSTREIQWSAHVGPSVDPSRTTITIRQTATRPDGTVTGTVTLVPRDLYGNNVGPGRGGDMRISGAPGTTVTGPVKDNGDGSYTVPVSWEPAAGAPGVVIGQPGRPPVVIGPTKPPGKTCKYCWLLVWLLLLLLLALGLMMLWLLR
jgi:hypothetical protein